MFTLIRVLAWMLATTLAFLAWLLVEVVIPAIVALCLLARDGWLAWRRYRSASRDLASPQPLRHDLRTLFSRSPGRG